ncbi:hypothetical protein EW093_01155 [Thiospirochaeta perfilievii]|uniref:Uncharacterized protein n=1 Tax=Thiospirochaeta perfilievii TaxID=252967 RepID=A0A5C1Q7T2_9SPIO|nr:hypothetical protein [Thiospirochaeta perfilievii]QEN03368.1 hypothetical protein EW093_01155 [Thiospirochaeta perfilievii]
MSFYSNRLIIELKKKNLDRDFEFFIITKSDQKKNWFGAKELDEFLTDNYKAKAVLYSGWESAYLMFNSDVDSHNLKYTIANSNVDFTIEKYQYDLSDMKSVRIIANLLLNYLALSKSKFTQYHFSNITGKLCLYLDKEKRGYRKGALKIAEVKLNSKNCITVDISTYREFLGFLKEYNNYNDLKKEKYKRYLKEPKYLVDGSTGSLRRNFDKDKDTKSYIKLGIDGTKVNVDSLSIKSVEDFQNCRLGIYNRVLKSIKTNLSDYMNIEFSKYDDLSSLELKNTVLKNNKDLTKLLIGKSINIYNTITDTESKKISNKLKGLIQSITENSIIVTEKGVADSDLNFVIIYSKDKYLRDKKEDPYIKDSSGNATQHIVLDTLENSKKPEIIVKTLLKELLIKNDILKGSISLFNWKVLGFNSDVTFISRKSRIESKRKIYIYSILVVNTEGNLKFEHFKSNSFDLSSKQLDIIEMYEHRYFVEGIIKWDDNINIINNYGEIVLPDLELLENQLHEVNSPIPDSIATGIKLADELTPMLGNDHSVVNEFRLLGQNKLSKKAISKTINLKSKEGKSIRDFLLENYSLRLKVSRSKESLKSILINQGEIKYSELDNDHALYFVGQRGALNERNISTCSIRRIESDGKSKLFFDKLLPTMDVDFVSLGKSTVVPFPFKYLREYTNKI